jgi:response regulator NasT
VDEHVLAFLVKPVESHQLAPAIQIAWNSFQQFRNISSENASLRQTLQNRKIIERAKGILMKKYRWSEAEAFRRIQKGAMNRRMTMADLANGILAGEEIDLTK